MLTNFFKKQILREVKGTLILDFIDNKYELKILSLDGSKYNILHNSKYRQLILNIGECVSLFGNILNKKNIQFIDVMYFSLEFQKVVNSDESDTLLAFKNDDYIFIDYESIYT